MDRDEHSQYRAPHTVTEINYGLRSAASGRLARHGRPGQGSTYLRTAIIRYPARAVGLKPSASQGEARLRGRERNNSSKIIRPRLDKAKPPCAERELQRRPSRLSPIGYPGQSPPARNANSNDDPVAYRPSAIDERLKPRLSGRFAPGDRLCGRRGSVHAGGRPVKSRPEAISIAERFLINSSPPGIWQREAKRQPRRGFHALREGLSPHLPQSSKEVQPL